jgi:hypothetical protein
MKHLREDPTPSELARELGLCPEAVRLWCRAGWGYKLGPRSWRIPRERIDVLLAARAAAAPKP